jgi:crotonobetainyl-CoA:carnitine CoA-transferase CaiB-like acyl-CoA transferase
MTQAPLHGIKVVDFGHTVMGPSCGMILADLGATVIKVEPAPQGDPTRHLKGFGIGYFGYFNRNKQSVAIDLKTSEGLEVARRLIDDSDVLIENFGPGTMERLQLDYDTVRQTNDRLIYASLKGFFDGPYGDRLALDEVVQMMTGLAFMTGPLGRPLRAGTSVVDIMGGMFAVIGIQAALRVRDQTGKGQRVGSALYESSVFMMGQHLCYAAQSDAPIPPMPERVSAWSVYETFEVSGGARLFVGITSDQHWQRFCREAGLAQLLDNPDLATNNGRIERRGMLIPILESFFRSLAMADAVSLCERCRIPFAEVRRPEELFEDPHLQATQGLLPVTLPNGTEVALPRLPLQMEGLAHSATSPPAIGQDTRRILGELGYAPDRIEALLGEKVIAASS